MNLLETTNSNEDNHEAEVYITVSVTPLIKMLGGHTYIGNLPNQKAFVIYQIDETLLKTEG